MGKGSLGWDTPHLPSAVREVYFVRQCLSQDLETGCLKLAVVKCWGVQIFKGIPCWLRPCINVRYIIIPGLDILS